MLKTALKYIAKGKSIIPVGQNKIPCIDWKEFQSRIATEKEVREWWEKYPDANIGLVTGKISGVAVVDIERGGSVTGLPPTLCATTGGGGWHLYYKYQDGVENKTRIRELMDIRGEGGYVVAPPSIHASGVSYEWVNDVEMVDFPMDLFEVHEKRDWKKIVSGVTQGSRNETASKLLGKLMGVFHPTEWQSIVYPMLVSWNKENKPPLPDTELRAVYDSISKRAVNDEQHKDTMFVPFNQMVDNAVTELKNTKASDIVSLGYDWLDERLTGLFKGELLVVGGESGCLHPNTKIYNPIDKTNFTVKDRCKRNEEFFVYALDDNNKPVVTRAEVPRKFIKSKMYELSNGKRRITVTGKHRVFDGENYTTVDDLQEFSSVLLPTTSEFYLSMFCLSVFRLKKTALNFQSYYHQVYHFYGGLLHQAINTFSTVFPSPTYVRELGCEQCKKGGLVKKQEHSHLCPLFCHLSKQSWFFLNYKKTCSEFYNHLTQDTFLQTFQKHPLAHRFFACLFPFCGKIYKFVSVLLSKVYKTFLDFLCFSFFKYNKWGVKQQQDEYYYDFTVPKYKNYFAEGLFHHNTGKTTFATNIIYKASQKKKCAVFALEDRLTDYSIKALYFEIGREKYYPWNDFRRNEIRDPGFPERLKQARENLQNDNIFFADVDAGMTIEELEKVVEHTRGL